ncbi:MAG: AMP-binding protein, partial [Planctomycetota bacterium]
MKDVSFVPPRQFVRMCRTTQKRQKLADSTGQQLTGGELLLRTLVVRRLLRRVVLETDERYVGILLPPTVAGAVVNAAVTLDRRIAVNLNYTVSSAILNECIGQCGIRHVITSRRVLEKLRERFPIEIACKVVYLEDLVQQVSRVDKLVSYLQAYWTPLALLERTLKLDEVQPDDTMTVIFTSGATGRPKGVVLSYRNIGSNIEAVNQVVRLARDDVLVGILPLFHSFGYTVTLWTVLTLEPKGIYHYSPLEAREIGKLCRNHQATILIATPTFLRSYLRRCEPEDFRSLDVAFVGAEKMPIELANAFERAFGVRPTEGYGTTELSPVAAANMPPSRALRADNAGVKEGSVGRPLPGIRAKVVELESGEDLGVGEAGMLCISGPNVMQGYLNRPDLTREVIRDGWYVTGDVAEIDDEGFIHITGRLARFSKLGGEMVPHIRIEEVIAAMLRLPED